ncbi:MAG: lysylphosphatidylglycerol synthase domain-containing protein, partial [Thermodesulfovibrionales bacterium]
QLVIICSAYVISRGVGIDVPFYFLSIIIPIISVISSIPISISGLGVREASFVLLLAPLGVNHAEAITLSLTWFLSFAVGSLPGLILYLRLKA